MVTFRQTTMPERPAPTPSLYRSECVRLIPPPHTAAAMDLPNLFMIDIRLSPFYGWKKAFADAGFRSEQAALVLNILLSFQHGAGAEYRMTREKLNTQLRRLKVRS